jgi:hypothetical protein
VPLKQALAERGIRVAARLEDADLFLVCCRGVEWNEGEWASAVEYLHAHPRERAWLVALQLTPAPLPPLLQAVVIVALHTHWKDGINAILTLMPSEATTQGSDYSARTKDVLGTKVLFESDGTPGNFTVETDQVIGDDVVAFRHGTTACKRTGGEQ